MTKEEFITSLIVLGWEYRTTKDSSVATGSGYIHQNSKVFIDAADQKSFAFIWLITKGKAIEIELPIGNTCLALPSTRKVYYEQIFKLIKEEYND